ncbi:glycosyltransferase [Salinibacillus xinjiangensis]|uniref:glycosyltransferase n=1 Tax=Salinibacillus xinjiangensis TaxID=1229268 RepID=UPI00189157D2|nr:glycosyltransferase [Salinibacillus xinjiangensis]
MKALMVAPNYHQARGNTVTVNRMADGLKSLGVHIDIISHTNGKTEQPIPEADIVHGFHAYRFYTFMEKLNEDIHPYVLTITGTDLNHDLFDGNKRDQVVKTLQGARAIHVFDKQAKHVLNQEIPDIKSKIYVIHQGTSFLPKSELKVQREKDTFLFVLPAGIRKVKNVPSAIHMLQKLRREFPFIRLCIVGPVLEEQEGELIRKLVSEHDEWVQYLGEVKHENMGAIYEQADTVLNTSISEGQPAAILEAMNYGLPVVAADNHGNRSIIHQGENGFIYHSEDEFLDYAENIINNSNLRRIVGNSAKHYISTYHSRKYEAEKLFDMYQNAVKNSKKG